MAAGMRHGCPPRTHCALRCCAPRPVPQISALHIESALLEHPLIGEVAVLGLPDPEYGEVRSAGGQALCQRGACCMALDASGLHKPAGACLGFEPLGSRAGGPPGCPHGKPACSIWRRLQTIAAVVALKAAPPQAGAAGSSNSDSAAGSNGNGAAPGLTLRDLRAWARERLPPYQLPRQLELVEAIPRNAMGKVNKKELRKQLFPEA